MTAAVLLATGLFATTMPWSRLVIGAGGLFVVTEHPVLVMPLSLCGFAVLAVWRVRQRREDELRRRGDTATLAELTAVGLTGGLSLHPSLALAAATLGGPVGAETEALLGEMRIAGVDVLRTAGGSASALYRTMGRAAVTGASLLDPVTRLADELHAARAAAQLEAVRRLPVAMLFPLTLLILPGFLLLTVAPALLAGLRLLET